MYRGEHARRVGGGTPTDGAGESAPSRVTSDPQALLFERGEHRGHPGLHVQSQRVPVGGTQRKNGAEKGVDVRGQRVGDLPSQVEEVVRSMVGRFLTPVNARALD